MYTKHFYIYDSEKKSGKIYFELKQKYHMNKDINVSDKGLCNDNVIKCIARRKTLIKTVI